ncbi:MAG: DCC1-like thiol-disulfide oxidoreductase family protein [Deltaproteobacteria bacterium]|nr:DCC1-like thiol-disulfide oxidoreductase family protein [Deltaproteobacteria bacterium]
MTAERTPNTNHLLLYDGVCALCHASVKFILRFDKKEQFVFAALQSRLASDILKPHRIDPADLDTMILVENFRGENERAWTRSDGAFRALYLLGGIWRVPALGRYLPRFIRDRCYRIVVRTRYRVFGKYETCPLPPPDVRRRFLDQSET